MAGEAGAAAAELPFVSVITPCLDPGERLARCIRSVASQDYARIEHIVVDGGSTDGTVALLADSSVQWTSSPDSGQADAIDKGFRLARGDLIGWLNADDVLLPGAVAVVAAALTGCPGAGFAYGDCEIIAADSSRHILHAGAIHGVESLFDSNPVPQPGALITRTALDRVGGIDKSFELAMDYDLWLRLVDGGYDGIYVPQTLARFEIWPSSKTGSRDWSEFLREEAIALGKTGHCLEAGVKLGAAAAFARSSHAARQTTLHTEVEAALEWASSRGLAVRTAHVRAGAASAASTLGCSRRRLLHLLRPELWSTSRTRRAVLSRALGKARTIVAGRRS